MSKKYTLISYVHYINQELIPVDAIKINMNYHAIVVLQKVREIIKGDTPDKKYVLYSFSEHLVNIFGHAVMNNIVNTQDIDIIVIDECGNVSHHEYDKEGFVTNWPYGFFFCDLQELANFKK